MDSLFLVKLCSRAWSLPALAAIAQGVPARVSPLAAALGSGRTAMGSAVAQLVELGLLETNPGFGHPLRPEFRLTPSGQGLARWAMELDALVDSDEDWTVLRGKWSLAVLRDLTEERRYSDLRMRLVPVTDRALTQCLRKLSARKWIERRVSVTSAPPVVRYAPIAAGEQLIGHLQSLPDVA